MARKTKQDWLNAGFSILEEQGVSALTIENLLYRMSLTKGSFYHHFKNYDEFKRELLQNYEDEGTLATIRLVESVADPVAKIKQLLDISASSAPDFEIALRSWALQDGYVRNVQERVDRARIAYIEEIFLLIYDDLDTARLMARMLYTILVGSQQLQRPIQGEALRALLDEYLRLYELDA